MKCPNLVLLILSGTCNNNRSDDCMLPDGRLVDDCAEMADYWQAKDMSNLICKSPPGLSGTTAPTKPSCPINKVCEVMKSE